METLYEVKGRTLIVYMPEEIDHHISEKINEETQWFITSNNVNEVVFDFEKTDFMDSSGIGIVMVNFRMMNSMGGRISVRNANRNVDRALTISGVSRVIREQNKEGEE